MRADAPDEALVAAVLDGRRDLFGLLVRRYQDLLYRHALGMVGDADAAADLVQEAFITAFRKLRRCRNGAHFRSWVFRILRNRCIDHLRRGRWQVQLDALEHSPFLVSPDADPEERAERASLWKRVSEVLGGMSADLREAFLMKHVQELEYAEMMEITGASASALKMRVLRAREALQAALGAEFARERVA